MKQKHTGEKQKERRRKKKRKQPKDKKTTKGMENKKCTLFPMSVLFALQSTPSRSTRLPVTTEREGVVALPDVATARTRLVVAVALAAETTVLLAGRGEAADLAVLVDGVADPVDLGVTADGRVRRVDHDDLEELEGAVLADRVRVEHAQVHAAGAGALLGDRAQVARARHAEDPLVAGLAPHDATVRLATAATTADAHAVHDVALLRLVAEHARLVGARRVRRAVHDRHVAQLPAAHTRKEAHHIALLLLPELADETVCTHGDSKQQQQQQQKRNKKVQNRKIRKMKKGKKDENENKRKRLNTKTKKKENTQHKKLYTFNDIIKLTSNKDTHRNSFFSFVFSVFLFVFFSFPFFSFVGFFFFPSKKKDLIAFLFFRETKRKTHPETLLKGHRGGRE